MLPDIKLPKGMKDLRFWIDDLRFWIFWRKPPSIPPKGGRCGIEARRQDKYLISLKLNLLPVCSFGWRNPIQVLHQLINRHTRASAKNTFYFFGFGIKKSTQKE